MKNIVKLGIILIVIIFVFIISKNENKGLKDLTLENVEALAQSEGAGDFCAGSGSIDCNSWKVYFKGTAR